jgi:Ran GTPase-activating protein (RanGAP) involved in mRNA processing and transport
VRREAGEGMNWSGFMEDSEYEQLLALAQHARLTTADARRLEVEAERRQDLRGYFTGLLRQDRNADLKRVAYERSATGAARVAEALSQLPAEPPVWTALLTASAVWSEAEHDLVARNTERWPNSVRVAPASWCADLVAGEVPAYWAWVRGAKLLREEQRSLAAVLGIDAMRQVELLDLSHNDLGDEGVERVAASSCLGGLEVLLAVGVGCMDRGAIALAEATGLPVLESLSLSRNDIEADGAARLIGINRLTALHSIDLSVNPIDARELASALRHVTARPGGLRSLVLEDNGIGADGIGSLAELPHIGEIEHLGMSGNDILATGVEALASRRLIHLRSLSLANAGLGTPGIAALVQASWLPRLRMLDLSDNAAGDDGLAALLHSGRLGGLEVLRFAHNGLTDLAGRLLQHHTGLMGLRELYLGRNALTGSGCATLVSNPALGWIELLDLSGTCTDGSGDELALALQADHMRSLVELRLPTLGERGVKALARADNLASLRRLQLGTGTGPHAVATLRAAPHLATCDVRIGA